jgi:hypothetical protein
MAERTGTAVRSRPGSNAKRTPHTAAGGNPLPAIHCAIRERRTAVSATDVRAWILTARCAVIAAQPTSISAQAAAPPSKIPALNENPGEISALRASPIGVKAESP